MLFTDLQQAYIKIKWPKAISNDLVILTKNEGIGVMKI